MRTRTLSTALAAAALGLCASAGHARGGGDVEPVPKEDEAETRALETQTLGPEHAAEHAAIRAAQRREVREWKRMTPQERQAELSQSEVAGAEVSAAGPASQVGQWTSAPFPIPNYAIHSVVLPTGKVLFWGYPPFVDNERGNRGLATLWDPTKGTGAGSMKDVAPPEIDVDGDGDLEAAPIYCSGQSFLPSGAVLVTGGNLIWASDPDDDYDEFAGHNRAFTFDPWSETWTEQPQMRHGRWYPSQVELADGRTAMLGGYSEDAPGALYNPELEIFTPSPSPSGVGTMQHKATGDRQTSTYPNLFTLPSGDVALGGSNRYDSAVLGLGSFSWTDFAPAARHHDAGSDILMPGGPEGSSTIAQFGGYDLRDPAGPDNVVPASGFSESVDAGAPSPSWSTAPSLVLDRSSHNTVLLPDGSMATIGGGRGWDPDDLGNYVTQSDGSLRQMELYDPVTQTWNLGPAQQEDRAYHSTAVLLPDGRVMSAGDDYHPSGPGGTFSDFDTAEIYSPPYLFKGARPVISSAPGRVDWGEGFEIHSSSPGLERAVLMAPDATTHGGDMQQRNVPLEVTPRAGGGFNAVAPASGGVAPPGYYMLFLLNDQGVPSVASWVQVGVDPLPGAPRVAGTGPDIRLSFKRAGSRRGRLIATVSSDEAGEVKLALKAKPKRGKPLARRRAVIEFDKAGTHRLVIRLKRGSVRAVRRVVSVVQAVDAQGNQTSWRRALRVGR